MALKKQIPDSFKRLRNHFSLAVLLLITLVFAVQACGNKPRYERAGDRGPLGRILFGKNATERKMDEGIYQLTVADGRDKHEIRPLDMMLFFASQLTRENGYKSFVMLPHDEKPYQDPELRKLRKRVLQREFDEFMKNPSIRVKTTERCQGLGCSTTYKSRAIIVMLKGDELKQARSFDADKVYETLKSKIPLPDASGT